MIGILLLGVTGAYSLFKAEPVNVKKLSAQTTTSNQDDTTAPTTTAADRTPPPLNYHVPFTEVTDAAGYPLKANGNQRTSLDVEDALKKHPDVSEAAVIVSPGDDKSDRATAFVELKIRESKRVAVTPKLEEGLREAVARATGLPEANTSLKFVDSVVKARSGVVNRHYYRELEAGREANQDAAALMPLVPVANLALPLLLALGTVWVAWRAVNAPAFGDFLIATEAEMNKVSWTTRKRLIQDTIVVLVCLLLLTAFLLVIDLFWGWLLSLDFIGVLPKKSDTGGASGNELNLKW
jgi:preprotein translocase SecE subunit